MNYNLHYLGALILLALSFSSYSQDQTSNRFGKGISIAAEDSSFTMKFGTRFQTLYEGVYDAGTEEWSDKLLIRRARIKFDGYAFSPKLEYKIELGLSNRDHGGEIAETNNTSNVVMDAVVKYKFAPGWALWFGQTKLPGNRERVISSQKLQFVDRSLVNSRFNIDRDIGIQLHHKGKLGGMVLKQVGSISMGEGRNITSDNSGGYDYTLRLEVLPFGEFTSKGDYFASDLKREPKPKLSIAATYDYNDGAARQRGQLGSFLEDLNGNRVYTDLSAVFVDMMFKYQGLQVMAEYANKKNVDENFALTGPGETKGFFTGSGIVGQVGYLLKNNLELAGRFTQITPEESVITSLPEETEYTFGLSRYFSEHNLKIQSDFSVTERPGAENKLRFRLQMEVSF